LIVSTAMSGAGDSSVNNEPSAIRCSVSGKRETSPAR
jgi:hypothetical protein